MLVLPISFISAAKLATENKWGLLNIIQVHWIISFVLTMFLRGFISFITHYAMHKVPLLWRIHRVHHLDTEMDVSTTVRFHPFEFFANLCIGVPIIILFGFPVWPLLLYELLDIVITLISHSNIQMPKKLDSILRYIIVTPNLHRIHHSTYQPETDSNFSAVFPLWDILFGTFRTKTIVPSQSMELGLEEIRDDRTSNILWLLLSPLKTFQKKRKMGK
jgi:sterol desaturase/sphingolipid hydroxylase (fatty acid hydroxylase superfamily)